jgi:drug/metabolite transporter (DMT)-like permease
MNHATTVAKAPFPLFRLLAGSVCISFSPVFIKLANVSADSAGFYRMLFAGLSLLVLFLFRGDSLNISRKSIFLLFASGGFLAIDFMCWHRSIHLVGPGFSTLLGNFQVFFTALFSYVFLKQKITRLFMLAILIALAGLLLITGVDWNALDEGIKLGIIFGIGTALFYSGYIMLIKESMNNPSLSGVSAMLVVSIASTVVLGLVTPLTGSSFAIPDAGSLFALIGAGVVSTTIGWSMISSAIKTIPATMAQ